MPIYQYACGECGHALEALQKMSDAPLTDCPECKKSALSKQLTAAAFQLKGTGWYETDFKNSSKKPDSKTADSKAVDSKTVDSKATNSKAVDSKSNKSESKAGAE